MDQGDFGRLAVDTGSGGVVAEGVACRELMIDTGSGSVRVALTRMGEGKFLIDTGSGSIDLLLPPVRNADIHADTGNGPIHVDLAGGGDPREIARGARAPRGNGGLEGPSGYGKRLDPYRGVEGRGKARPRGAHSTRRTSASGSVLDRTPHRSLLNALARFAKIAGH